MKIAKETLIGKPFPKINAAERATGRDLHPYYLVYEDLHQACRLALELASVPGDYQELDLLSFEAQGKYRADKARRILGFEPAERWDEYLRRPTGA